MMRLFCVVAILAVTSIYAGGGTPPAFDIGPAFVPNSCFAIEFTPDGNQQLNLTPQGIDAATGQPFVNGTTISGPTVIYWTTAQSVEICDADNCETYNTCNCNPIPSDDSESAPLICDINTGYCGTSSGMYEYENNSGQDAGANGPWSGSLENTSWLRFIPDASTISFEVDVFDNCSFQFAVFEETGQDNYNILTDPVWTSVDGFTGIGNIIDANNLTPGNEYYIVVDGDGGAVCDYQINFTTGIQPPTLSTVGGGSVCSGDAITLTVEPDYSGTVYEWTDDVGTTYASTTNTLTVNPTQQTTYTVKLLGGDCYLDEELTTTVTIDPNCGCTPPAITAQAISGCSPLDLNSGLTDDGGGNVTFHNSQADADNATNAIPDPTNVTTSGDYYVRSQNGGDVNCYSTAVINVDILGLTVNVNLTQPSTCGADGSLDLSGMDPSTNYDIDINDGNGVQSYTSDASGNLSINLPAGSYDPLSIVDAVTGCSDNPNGGIISDPSSFSLSETHTDPTCGSTDGSITVTVTGASGNETYSWSPNGETTKDLSNLGAGTYILDVIDGGCTGSISVDLVSPGGPSITAINSDEAYCVGGSSTLAATSDIGSITWEDDLGNPFNDGDLVSPTVTTVYTATADANGCTIQESFTVTITNPPTFTVTPQDPTSCGATDGTLTLTGLNPSTDYNVNDGSGAQLITSDGSGTIVLTGYGSVTIASIEVEEAGSGCSSIDNTGWMLVAPGAPTVTVNNSDITYCMNGTEVLSATASIGTITWSDDQGNPYNDGDNVSPSATTTYTATADNAGCTATASFTITISNGPIVNLLSSDADYCMGETITPLNASTTSGIINWYDANNALVGTGTSFTPPSADECYSVQADENGCLSPLVGTVCITINSAPPAPNINGQPTYCTGDTVILSTGDINTQWYSNAGATNALGFGNFITSYPSFVTTNTVYAFTTDPVTGCQSPISSFTYDVFQGGYLDVVDTVHLCYGSPYVVAISASDTADWGNGYRGMEFTGIATTDTILTPSVYTPCGDIVRPVVVLVHPLPVVDAGPDQTGPRGTLFEVDGSGAYSYEWELVNNTSGVNYLDCPTCASTEGYILFTSLYNLTGWTEYGCVDTDTLLITIDGMINAFVPNVFSPNGDGQNDVFRVLGPDFYNYSMVILNRWGEVIFETDNNDEGWDGTWRNKPAGSGVYTYMIEGRAVSGEDVNFGGNVTLVR